MTKFDEEKLFEIGEITKKIREEVIEFAKQGIKFSEIVEFVEDKIFDLGFLPAFPCTVCVNDIAAHYTYFDEDFELKKGDVVKIDFGICHNDIITDNAVTVEIETFVYKDLIKANLDALNSVLENIKVGTSMSEIGEIVYDVAKKRGFNTIHNLSGHQIKEKNLHAGLSVPNYKNLDKRKVCYDMTLAIEPFFTTGDVNVCEGSYSNILKLVSLKNVRDIIAKKVLNYIKENYSDLPFSKRWLLKKFDKKKVLYALKILKLNQIIYEYPILVSCSKDVITQFEHTVVFNYDKKLIITK